MTRGKLSVAPAAVGLALSNLITVAVTVGCVIVAGRAWQVRDEALTTAARAQATVAQRETGGQAPAAAATVHSTVRRLRRATLDRILLFGALGVVGSVFFTWRLVRQSLRMAREHFTFRPIRGRSPERSRARGPTSSAGS
jgi:hypothetical protein